MDALPRGWKTTWLEPDGLEVLHSEEPLCCFERLGIGHEFIAMAGGDCLCRHCANARLSAESERPEGDENPESEAETEE